MTALYPDNFPRWEPKITGEIVESEHVNKLQDELEGTQMALGTNIQVTPKGARAWYPSDGARPNTATDVYLSLPSVEDFKWATLHDRITNIERAALRDLDMNYVSLLGASVIDPRLNSFRPPGTGGVGIIAADGLPALAVFDSSTKGSWEEDLIAGVWGSGRIKGTSLDMGHAQLSNGPVNTAVFGSLSIDAGTGSLHIGDATLRADSDKNVPLFSVALTNKADGDSMFVQHPGHVRNVLRIADTTGATSFLIDSEGNLFCKSINGQEIGPGDPPDGYTLDKTGLVFHAGGEYRPTGLQLKDGTGLSENLLTFGAGPKVTAFPERLEVAAPLTAFSGAISTGMDMYMYTVSGTMFIPVPPYSPTGHAASKEGVYDYPRSRDSSTSSKRKAYLPFTGPQTGAMEVHLSVEVRSYSRPTWVSYSVWDVSTTTARLVLAADDAHSCMNNGARAQVEQTDVDQVRVSNFNIVRGLTPGRSYELRVECRAADPGYGERDIRWIQASGLRALLRPVMTRVTVKEIAT